MGQGVQPKMEGTSRGMLRGPRGVSGRACNSSPLIQCPHEVTGQDLPFREDKGDQTTPKSPPIHPHPCPQPGHSRMGERPEGPAPLGDPRGGTGDIACEGGLDRPGRAAPVTCSHAMGGWGGKLLLKDQGGGPTSRSLARGQGGARATQDQPPGAGWWLGSSPALGHHQLGPLDHGMLPSPARGQQPTRYVCSP